MAEENKSDSQARREADYSATQKLKEAHLAEFNDLKVKEMKARGIDWKPKPTEREKAAAQVAELVAKYGPGIVSSPGEVSAPTQ
jgi:hypothetical protein